jgi:hypothetical protein
MRTSLQAWEDFKKGSIWLDLLDELEERDGVVNQKLRVGDDKWSDDNMRGRLSELEYIASLVDFIILDLKKVQEDEKEKEDARPESGSDAGGAS